MLVYISLCWNHCKKATWLEYDISYSKSFISLSVTILRSEPISSFETQKKQPEKTGWLTIMRELVGGWTNPFEKYARQIGSFPPRFGVKIKHMWVATNQIHEGIYLPVRLWFLQPMNEVPLANHYNEVHL